MTKGIIVICDPDGIPIPGIAPLETESNNDEAELVHYYRMDRAEYEAMRQHLPKSRPWLPDGIDEPFYEDDGSG